MNKVICFFAALTVSVSALAETSPVQFRSILTLRNTQHFSVAAGGGAKWVRIGDSFQGYNVIGFDAAENVLILRKENVEFRVGLAAARVAEMKANPAGEESIPASRTRIPGEAVRESVDWGLLELSANIPKRLSLGEGKECDVIATVLPSGALRLDIKGKEMLADEEAPDGTEFKGLVESLQTIVVRDGSEVALFVGHQSVRFTPILAAK